MNGLAAGLAQCTRQRGRKLRIHQKEQNLFRRNDGMVCLPRGKSQNRVNIGVFKIRIILENRFSRFACRQQVQNVRNRYAQAPNAWTPMHLIGIDRYSFQKI